MQLTGPGVRASGGTLAAARLSYRYPGASRHVVAGFTHTFDAGTLTAIVAPSGAGKSTLLSLLGLLLAPDDGTVSVDGTTCDWRRRAELTELRTQRFAWVLQNNACFEKRTATDNVAVALLASGTPMRRARDAAASALETVGLAAQGRQPAGQLSGGERQRMTIARALVAGRPVMLADEPTGNLDRASSLTVFDALRACAHAGATVVVATHDLQLAAVADHVVDLAADVCAPPGPTRAARG
ncbi:ABC transporter ATP-binding protein [Xylanimonas sp. McL0601]|uniref:ABC transporter ATP-binding protein n=1 Tax=Xylanimonas sp. McL0601 TaxID=3414739 RepID=UPI003CEF0407